MCVLFSYRVIPTVILLPILSTIISRSLGGVTSLVRSRRICAASWDSKLLAPTRTRGILIGLKESHVV